MIKSIPQILFYPSIHRGPPHGPFWVSFDGRLQLSWKMIKKVLYSLGRKELSGSPKPILRDAFEDGLISDLEIWFSFLVARNMISHVYGEHYARQIFEIAKTFPPCVEALISNLESKTKI